MQTRLTSNNRNDSGYRKWHLILAGIFILGLSVGCQPHPRENDEKRLEDIKREANALYDAYLHEDYSSAKSSLEKSIALADKLAFVPHYQAGHLYFCYARLYVLERRSGNEALAEAALVKARYWSLRESELGNISAEKAGAIIKRETGDQIMEFIDNWDKSHNDGKAPKYHTPITTGLNRKVQQQKTKQFCAKSGGSFRYFALACVSGHSKPARDGRMKTSHFESGIAHRAAIAALMPVSS